MDLKSNLSIHSDSSKQNTTRCSIKEDSKFDELQNKFEKRVESLENELRCLQNEKHKIAVSNAELESKLEIEKRQSESLRYNFDCTITDLKQVNEDINEKYKRKCVELDTLESENKSQKQKMMTNLVTFYH